MRKYLLSLLLSLVTVSAMAQVNITIQATAGGFAIQLSDQTVPYIWGVLTEEEAADLESTVDDDLAQWADYQEVLDYLDYGFLFAGNTTKTWEELKAERGGYLPYGNYVVYAYSYTEDEDGYVARGSNLATKTLTYTSSTATLYTISFVNYDGTVLQTSAVEAGLMPVYNGATPVRPEDAEYTYTFSGWSPALVVASANTTYTATYTATSKFTPGAPAGVEMVDLGLPSGTLWANMNVGATSPGEFGAYFAWGETEPKDDYSWETYKWCNGSPTTITKYCVNSSYGTVDNKTTLDLADDAAHVNWGGDWRMPTHAEQQELKDECTWSWSSANGHKGYRVTGPNGNSIFLPVAGTRNESSFYSRGSYGFYSSSSLSESGAQQEMLLFFNSSSVRTDYFDNRYIGFSIRPVLVESSPVIGSPELCYTDGKLSLTNYSGAWAIYEKTNPETPVQTGTGDLVEAVYPVAHEHYIIYTDTTGEKKVFF